MWSNFKTGLVKFPLHLQPRKLTHTHTDTLLFQGWIWPGSNYKQDSSLKTSRLWHLSLKDS